MPRSRRAAIAVATVAVAALVLAPATVAQFRGQRPGKGPLLGMWSTAPGDPQSPPPGGTTIYFRIDGLYQQRLGTPTGNIEIIGTWHWDEKQSVLHWQPEEFSPKDQPPPEPMGKPKTAGVQFVNPDLVVLPGAGGPVRLTRLK